MFWSVDEGSVDPGAHFFNEFHCHYVKCFYDQFQFPFDCIWTSFAIKKTSFLVVKNVFHFFFSLNVTHLNEHKTIYRVEMEKKEIVCQSATDAGA